ncbi:MAG: hypothetical protein HY363_00905 [Candidatus Aenigmarchaeota archaeon]|nr:hypothetical protein [Candidatus Aenigmarchaeota archaeon]
MKTLLELRKAMKRSRPKFLRTHYGALPRLSKTKTWRRPTGIHNKLRHNRFGRPISVTIGYRSPSAVRGLDKNGLLPVRIHTPADVSYLDSKKHSAIIAHVGMKNRLAILSALKTKGVSVLNYKDADLAVKKIQESYARRIELARKKVQVRMAAAKEREIVKPKHVEKPKQAAVETTQLSDDAKKVQEKKELDKVLTKKE